MSHLGFTSRSAAGHARDRHVRVLADTCGPHSELDRVIGSGSGPRSGRVVRAAGATMAVGALATVLTASGTAAVAGLSTTTARELAVTLMDSSSPFQPELDQIIAAQQEITATNSAYPFITEFDQTLLPGYVQNSALLQLGVDLSQLNLNNSYDEDAFSTLPYLWNAPAAEPQNFLNSPNPDETYNLLSVGNQTEVVTIDPAPGTEEVTFVPMSGTGASSDFHPLSVDNLSQFTPNANGTYTIDLSPTEQPGNWVDTDGAQSLLIRDDVGDWAVPHDDISVQLADQPAFTLPILSDDQISSTLTQIGADLPIENGGFTLYGLQSAIDSVPDNIFAPFRLSTTSVGGGPILPGQISGIGHFDLQPDQALIVQVPNFEATYSAIQIDNDWTQTSAYATVEGSLNNTDTFQDPDGYTYYVIGDQNPGVANFIDDSDLQDGAIIMRIQGLDGSIPATPTTEVVPIADVSQYLPADTPEVTPAEYTADLQERLFSYDYAIDQDHTPEAWVTANLEYGQLQSAIGTTEFDQIFGTQQDVPSVLDRLTETALIPNMDTIANDVVADPSGSLSALVENLPLAVQDIELPEVLATLRVEEVIGQTAQAVEGDVSSDQPSQALTALSTGAQELGTVFDQTLTDPATSITAGILNARDDLSVALMNADSYSALTSTDFTSLSDQLSQLNESVSQMLSAGMSYLVSSFDPTDIAANAASTAGGLSLDLSALLP
jgi:hypothetical protein